MNYGCQSMTAPIRRIILKRPQQAFISNDHLTANWQAYHFTDQPDYQKVLAEYEQFEVVITAHVPQVHYLPQNPRTGLDSIYTHDPVKFTTAGAVLMNMGKPLRRDESTAYREFLAELEIPLLGEITAPGCMEGGDLVWLDNRTAAIAEGYRTNQAGIEQFRRLTAHLTDHIITVPLPHADGPAECLHLMSLISMVDHDLAVVYSRYMPVFFRNLLLDRGIRLIEVDDDEYLTLGSNVLALAPGKCLLMETNKKTRTRLEAAGVEVFCYPGRHLSLKGTGGPTCLTAPVWRES